jgi:ABC-type glycerol-3-phosphate transport system permease component
MSLGVLLQVQLKGEAASEGQKPEFFNDDFREELRNPSGQYEADWSLVSDNILLIILPVVVVYLLDQRFIVSGMTSEAIQR